MSGSGTDKTKPGRNLNGPVVILVEPQLGENIGMAARAMGNFALSRLRIVNPRDGWPNISAQRALSISSPRVMSRPMTSALTARQSPHRS